MVLCYSGRFLEAILGIIWDAFVDANWDVKWDANWDVNWDDKWDANWDINWDANQRPKQRQILKMDANWDANWDVIRDANWDANQCPKQRQILKMDANNAIKSAIPWKNVHFVQKMMKNTLKVIVDTKKEVKRDANNRVLLQ